MEKRLYVAKPAVMIFLIIWSIQLTGWKEEMLWFGIALVLSLIGDILLMMNPRYFMFGGAAFLLAHISYLVGFNQSPVPFTFSVMVVAALVGFLPRVSLNAFVRVLCRFRTANDS